MPLKHSHLRPAADSAPRLLPLAACFPLPSTLYQTRLLTTQFVTLINTCQQTLYSLTVLHQPLLSTCPSTYKKHHPHAAHHHHSTYTPLHPQTPNLHDLPLTCLLNHTILVPSPTAGITARHSTRLHVPIIASSTVTDAPFNKTNT